MNKIKISNMQLFMITMLLVVGPSTIIFSSSAAALVKQDAWLSVIVTTIAGLPVLWINTTLGSLYPEKTFFEIIQSLLGKWLGSFVSINFILMAIILATRAVSYVGNFFSTMYMQEPTSVRILFVISIAIALLYGLEAISRAISFLFFIVIFMYLLTIMFCIPDFKTENLFPILEQGITPVLKGAIPISSYSVFSMIFINNIYPVNVSDIKKAKKSMLNGYLFGMLLVLTSILSCILVLDSKITATSNFPVFLRSKQINVGVLFTRIEGLTIIDWLIIIFIGATIYYYSAILGLSQLIKLKDHKKIVLPLGLIIIVLSKIINKNVPYQMYWSIYVLLPYIFTFGFILPVVLLIIALIRNKIGKSQKAKSAS
jgi:spore germination protein KB